MKLPQSLVVISSLDRRRSVYRNVGWLYILRNRAFKEALLKVGKSTRFPSVRAGELARDTGVPEGFDVVYYVHVGDIHLAEYEAHRRLAKFRKSRSKEFFTSTVSEAVRVLDEVASEYPILLRDRGRSLGVLQQDFGESTVVCAGCGRSNRVKQLAIATRAKCSGCAQVL